MDLRGTLKISAPISPYGDEDQFPTHFAKYGFGGYRSVETLQQRDQIPQLRREVGMLVYVQENQQFYVLQGGLENDCWEIYADVLTQLTSNGRFVVSLTEPQDPQVGLVWLNPLTGIIMFRSNDNSKWELLLSTSVDGGSF